MLLVVALRYFRLFGKSWNPAEAQKPGSQIDKFKIHSQSNSHRDEFSLVPYSEAAHSHSHSPHLSWRAASSQQSEEVKYKYFLITENSHKKASVGLCGSVPKRQHFIGGLDSYIDTDILLSLLLLDRDFM